MLVLCYATNCDSYSNYSCTIGQALFFDILRKTQVEQKLRFLTKLRYFSRNSGPENAKRYLNRKNCNGSTFFMYLGFENFQKLRSIFVKLRSVFEKLRSEIAKNIPQPQIDINSLWRRKSVEKKAWVCSLLGQRAESQNFFVF